MDFATWRRLADRVAHHRGAARSRGRRRHPWHRHARGDGLLPRPRRGAARKPVVLTGAMRPATLARGRRAAQPRRRDRRRRRAGGAPACVVAFAGALHSARDVRKVHSSRLDAFSSGDAGPLGRVEDGRLAATARPGPTEPRLGLDRPAADRRALAWVEIVTSARRRRRPRRSCAASTRVSTGSSSPRPATARSIATLAAALEQAALPARIPVLRATRCLDGGVGRRRPERRRRFAVGRRPHAGEARVELAAATLLLARRQRAATRRAG